MADDFTPDRVGADSALDLVQLYANLQPNPEEHGEFSPFQEDCKYYSPDQFALLNTNNAISAFCINCQSLTSHWDGLCDILYRMNSAKNKLDIIGLTEVFKIHDNINYNISGYHQIVFKTRTDITRGRGGVALYINNKFQFSIRQDLSIFIPHVYESLFVEIAPTNQYSKSLIVGVVYRPNTPPLGDIDIFGHHFIDVINIINSEHKTQLIMGDMNIDLLKFDQHVKTNQFIEDIFALGMTPLITKPTRITEFSATLIDHIYTNNLKSNPKSGIIITDLADHFGIFTIIYKRARDYLQKSNVSFTRSFTSKNILQFNDTLLKTDFSTVLLSDCAETSYELFISIIKAALDQSFPVRRCINKRGTLKRDPWITPGILQSSKTKSKLHRIKLNHPTFVNIERYKDYCREFQRIKRRAKISYYREHLEYNKFNIKKTWELLKPLITSGIKKSSLPTQFILRDTVITDQHIVAVKWACMVACLYKLWFKKELSLCQTLPLNDTYLLTSYALRYF